MLPPLTRIPPQAVGYPTSSAIQRIVWPRSRRDGRQLPAAYVGIHGGGEQIGQGADRRGGRGDVSHEARMAIAERMTEDQLRRRLHQRLGGRLLLGQRGAPDQRTQLRRGFAGGQRIGPDPARKLAIRSTSRARRRNSSGDISSGATRSGPTRSSGFRGLLGVSRRRGAATRWPAHWRRRRGTRSESRSGPDRAAHRSVAAGGSGPGPPRRSATPAPIGPGPARDRDRRVPAKSRFAHGPNLAARFRPRPTQPLAHTGHPMERRTSAVPGPRRRGLKLDAGGFSCPTLEAIRTAQWSSCTSMGSSWIWV